MRVVLTCGHWGGGSHCNVKYNMLFVLYIISLYITYIYYACYLVPTLSYHAVENTIYRHIILNVDHFHRSSINDTVMPCMS